MITEEGSVREKVIYWLIKILKIDVHKLGDGHHTFEELYEHRFWLWIRLCDSYGNSWKSKRHSDGSMFNGMFILGLEKEKGKQLTYHLPLEYWDECDFAETLDFAYEWDEHTPKDVLERLKKLKPTKFND
jgi:hypothetical protein